MDNFHFKAGQEQAEARVIIEEFGGTGEEIDDQIRQNEIEAGRLGKWIRQNLTGKCWGIIGRELKQY